MCMYSLTLGRKKSVKRSQDDVIHAFIVCVTANMGALNGAPLRFIVNVFIHELFNNKIVYGNILFRIN